MTAKQRPSKPAKKKPAAKRKPFAKVKVAATGFDALPLRQRTFILEYLANGFNATQAAITAGYAKKNADTQASRLLAMPKIAVIVAERTQKALAKREMTAEVVLGLLADIALYDVRKLYAPDGSLLPITLLDDATAVAVASIGTRELYADGKPFGVLKNIKMADRLRAIELLGRHHKLFTDRVEHSADKEFVLTVKSILGGGKK